MMVIRARQEACRNHLGIVENNIDTGFHKGLNWAGVSQKHSMSLPYVDTAGGYTAIIMLTGEKNWAIRKTGLDGPRDKDVDDIDYIVDLDKRDLESLPGGGAAWLVITLRKGDVL